MSLEPLADYLKPQFGDIYSYNLPSAGSFEVQEWTDELRQAVKRFLVHEVSDDDYVAFLAELGFPVPSGTRSNQADCIIEQAELWEIAHAFHLAAITASTTLEQLIGGAEIWDDTPGQDDVSYWLDAHATLDQLRELAEVAGHPEREARKTLNNPEPLGEDFTWRLTPPKLIAAWHQVVGPAESDLTDDEWQLLLPLVEERAVKGGHRRRSDYELLKLRRAFDGIRYKSAREVPWSHVPVRYGPWTNVLQRCQNYRKRGEFCRMLRALRGHPGAERVVTWLERIASKPPERS